MLELSMEQRSRIFERLRFLYGERTAEKWLPEFERILKVHHAHKPADMIEKERDYDPRERFSQEHMILITYGDNVKGDGGTPLSSLHRFVDAYTGGMINILHILPFFPYSSDRGFAVIDFRRVDSRLGSWDDIREHKRRYDLMFDAVLNHCSSRSEMFQEFLNGNPFYRDFFISYDSPSDLTEEQRRMLFRPRTSDILTGFETIYGPRYVWTTFSEDQIDLNFRNPAALFQVMESILFYIRRGADLLRLDEVTYLWDEPGTPSVHLRQTHEIVKLLRDVVEIDASAVEEELKDPGSRLFLLARSGIGQVRARSLERAFHPRGSQRVLMLSPKVFAVLRISPGGGSRILAVTNVTGEPVKVKVSLSDLGTDQVRWQDLLEEREWSAMTGFLHLTVESYGVLWLKPL